MGKVNAKFIGLSQYRVPLSFELAGRHFHVVLDDGREFSLNFLDGETLQWAEKGQPYVWDTYECLKGDETTYLVHVQPECGKGKINHNWILDTAQRLVTFVLLEEGYNPEFPKLIRTTPFFGVIKVPGRALPEKRHHLSKRMVGRHIFWHYNPGFSIQHIYHSPINCRASAGNGLSATEGLENMFASELNSPDPEVRRKAQAKIEKYKERKEYYPFYEEESFHIYINDHLNLFCFLEENMNRLSPAHDEGGGGILLLQDIERVIDMGLCFSAGEYYMCTAYGDENEDGDPLDSEPSPYDWSKFEAMPSIKWEIPEDK